MDIRTSGPARKTHRKTFFLYLRPSRLHGAPLALHCFNYGILEVTRGAPAVEIIFSSSDDFFSITSVNLTLDNNITLKGKSDNTNAVVYIDSPGILRMKSVYHASLLPGVFANAAAPAGRLQTKAVLLTASKKKAYNN